MGRRSSFPRIAKDVYDTPAAAVAPLLPHLPKGVRYAEPCAGKGDLINHLAAHAECVWASDIAPRRADIHENDARTCGLGDAEIFVTNPPWTRALLHEIIVCLSDKAPTWLLFDGAWAFTKQARPFMERCRRIVTVGRVKWMPGSDHVGKEDAAWYLFDRPLAGSAPLLYGRGCLPTEPMKRPERLCHDCGVLIGRFGKWSLKHRNGVLTCVHDDCQHPNGVHVEEATPLLDYIEKGPPLPFRVLPGPEEVDGDIEIPAFLKRLAGA